MTHSERIAWVEFVVSTATAVAMGLGAIWFGHRATAAFGLIAFLPLVAFWLSRRWRHDPIDERDQQIHDRAMLAGVGWAWQALFLAVIAVHQWSVYTETPIPNAWVAWIVMAQFLICYGVKGASPFCLTRAKHALLVVNSVYSKKDMP